MKTTILTLYLVLICPMCFGQNLNQNQDQQQALRMREWEVKTEQCLDSWFAGKNVSWQELKTSFEKYFSDTGITSKNDPLDKQYLDILNFFVEPTRSFVRPKDKMWVLGVQKQLGLAERDMKTFQHLECLASNYRASGFSDEIETSFITFCSFAASLQNLMIKNPALQSEGISPMFLAHGLKLMELEDLTKSLYQKSIVLYFYFDLAMYL
jgi:hypothetical protein